ncbi:uncharacterized protein ARMOST_00334 [Armillaria ostoyae]|uniref:Alcohol dehydrogenase-like N-terminal domain-containing protein n=1 Tax=Armillaria ostoyae TaxID=47428 RepID=A0A284QKT0_ARMOS|nr:uncharacterized protein ARMOST_00334 [Armillaria ostoyae]
MYVEYNSLSLKSYGPAYFKQSMRPRRDDVLVRVEASGICGTDITIYKNFGLDRETLTKPVVMGHEAAGVVVQVGEVVVDVAVGDRVAIEPVFCKRPSQTGFICVGGIAAGDFGDFWIVGDVFLQNVYTADELSDSDSDALPDEDETVGFANLA